MADETKNDEPVPDESKDLPEIDVAAWFKERREIVLVLEGVRYRLRWTQRNRLLLQK